MRGKFIAIYGINNIGKSTQTRLLIERIHRAGVRVEYLKYPLYDLDPTGTKLNEILRGKKEKSVAQTMIEFFPGTRVRRPGVKPKNTIFRYQQIDKPKNLRQKVTEEELQMWYSLNRYQYDPQIQKKLDQGITILAEDYTGTGLAWGSAKGADLTWLESVNKFLTVPDIEILMDGERFLSGKEERHIHESNDRLIKKAQAQFQKLGKKYGWKSVNANQSIDAVASGIWQHVEPILPRRKANEEIEIIAPRPATAENSSGGMPTQNSFF